MWLSSLGRLRHWQWGRGGVLRSRDLKELECGQLGSQIFKERNGLRCHPSALRAPSYILTVLIYCQALLQSRCCSGGQDFQGHILGTRRTRGLQEIVRPRDWAMSWAQQHGRERAGEQALATSPSKGYHRVKVASRPTLWRGKGQSTNCPPSLLMSLLPRQSSSCPLQVPSKLSSIPEHQTGLQAVGEPAQSSPGCQRVLPARTSVDPTQIGPRQRHRSRKGPES